MQIRFAENKDVPGLLTLLRQVGKVHHDLRGDLFRENACKYGPSQLFALMESGDTPIFVAEEDNTILGYGFCRMQKTEKDPVFCDRLTLYIDDLCVLEDCRGKHIGTAIYNEILRYAKMRKCHAVTLNVWVGNESAEKFYRSLGLLPQKITMEKVL